MSLVKIAAFGALGYAGYRYFQKQKRRSPAAFGKGQPEAGPTGAMTPVRNAGADAMRDKPKTWSKTDEALDETFPASDPASTY